jgi:hypothetical protein
VLHVAQPGHWLGPVPGRAGWVQASPRGLSWTQPKKNKKNKKQKSKNSRKNKKCVCINKNNINLLVYSLTPESGIKIPV